jgi:acyl carrier protein
MIPAIYLGACGVMLTCVAGGASAQGAPACASLTNGRLAAEVGETVGKTLHLQTSQVQPQSRLVEDLKADELSQVEITMALEERFGVRIDDRVEPLAPDVQGIAEQVARLLKKRC